MVQRGYGETPAALITSKGSGQTSYTEAHACNSTLTYKLGLAGLGSDNGLVIPNYCKEVSFVPVSEVLRKW